MTKDVDILLGDPKKALLVMFVPLAVSFLVSQVNSFVDASWCSGLGVDASSAITIISPVYWIIASVGIGLSVAAVATVSFCIGANDSSKANRLASQILIIGLVSSILMSILMFILLDPIIDFMGAGDVSKLAKDYVGPFLIMSWASIVSSIIAGIIRAEGAAKKSMMVLISSVALNMILDPILIYTLGMGVAGAAWATCISALFSVILGLSWYVRDKMFVKMRLKGFKFNGKDVREILNVAAPRTIESTIIEITNLIQRVFIIFVAGTAGVAIFSLTWRYIAIAIIPSAALSSALIAVCSVALGQRNFKKAKAGVNFATKFSLIVCTIISVFVFIFADQLVILLSLSESMVELRPIMAWALRIYCLLIPFYAFKDLSSAILQSIRMSKKAALATLLINIMKLVLSGIASLYSFEAIFYSLIISNATGGILMVVWARKELKKYELKHASDATINVPI